MSRIFVSSTVYDLIDVRAEVETLLREMNLTPVMSDLPSSDFEIPAENNSIEACLINLRRCDTCIFIISQRYGRTLPLAEYKCLSATHSEYREALKYKKRILFYVRDRTMGVVDGERRNTGKELDHWWIPKRSDVDHLLSFIHEHTELKDGRDTSNWLRTFTDSVDLKSQLRSDLHADAARSQLDTAISDFRIPLVDVSVTIREDVNPLAVNWPVDVTLTNVGTTPAFRIEYRCDGDITISPENLPILAPGQFFTRSIPVPHRFDGTTQWQFRIFYYTPQSHRIQDRHSVGVTAVPGRLPLCSAHLQNKSYTPSDGSVSLYDIAPPASGHESVT